MGFRGSGVQISASRPFHSKRRRIGGVFHLNGPGRGDLQHARSASGQWPSAPHPTSPTIAAGRGVRISASRPSSLQTPRKRRFSFECPGRGALQHARQRVVNGRLLRIRPFPQSLPAAVSESPRPDHLHSKRRGSGVFRLNVRAAELCSTPASEWSMAVCSAPRTQTDSIADCFQSPTALIRHPITSAANSQVIRLLIARKTR